MYSDLSIGYVGCLARITPASPPPPPASPPFRQGRRCEKSVPVDPRSAVPLPDTTPPPPLRRGRSWGVSGGTWCRFLKLLQSKAAEKGSNLKPIRVMQDFERALMKATLEVFPDAQIKGCFFASVCGESSSLGLAVAYKEMPEIRTWFRMALALPMLPVAQVVDGFNLVKERSPDVLRIQEFNDYLFTTWVTGFSIEMWNYFRYDGPRTNNHVGIPQSAEEKSRESPPKPL